jgi:hypothetical protein
MPLSGDLSAEAVSLERALQDSSPLVKIDAFPASSG